MAAEAKYATPRDPARPTLGHRAAVISKLLGAPFMPWQRQVADVALEVEPATGTWRYKTVIVTVPRQSGKTTLLRAIAIDRALSTPAAQVFLTAQTGKDARARWRDWVKALEAPDSPLASIIDIKRGMGAEQAAFPNLSFIAPFAPTPKSLHGYTPPLVLVDECWAFDMPSGVALDAAINPAQITLPHRQKWMVSTMGDARSEWWHDQVEKGRASVDDPDSTVAFFEWSADETADPLAPATLGFHPAAGRREDGYVQTLEDLAAQATNETLGNWVRSYLNLRTRTRESVIDLDRFDTLAATATLAHPTPPVSECVFGYAVARDRSGGSIWAGHMHQGRPCVHLAMTKAGWAWMPTVLADLHNRGARGLAANDYGHTAAVTKQLETAGVPVASTTATEYSTACTTLLGRIDDATVLHDGASELRDAVEAATLRRLGGGRAFDAEKSTGAIDHLEAATVAAYRAEHLPTAIPIF